MWFPISRDPPEGGTTLNRPVIYLGEAWRFQFLGIPPKGEPPLEVCMAINKVHLKFPISRDPPEGGTGGSVRDALLGIPFPISRDPPEGGTTQLDRPGSRANTSSFQFLGIPPKGERLMPASR